MRCGKEEEAQALAAGECNQVAGFCFLGVGKEARHFNGDKEGDRTSNSNSLDSVGDGTVRREALRTGVDNLNDCFEGSKGFELGCQFIRVLLDVPIDFHGSDFVEARRDFTSAGMIVIGTVKQF